MADVDTTDLVSGANERGIPFVVFLEEDLDAFVQRMGRPVESILGGFRELHTKYQFMDANIRSRRKADKAKLPDQERNLELVRHLMTRQLEGGEEPVPTMYKVADNVFARAELDVDGRVGLWLGANVMVEYTYEEAQDILVESIETTKQRIATATQDLVHIKAQTVTCEVNTNRLINFAVRQKDRAVAEQKAGGAPSS